MCELTVRLILNTWIQSCKQDITPCVKLKNILLKEMTNGLSKHWWENNMFNESVILF